MNYRITITMQTDRPAHKPPRTLPDARLTGAVVLVLIGLVMAYVMIDANMNIRSYRRESMPLTREATR